LNDQRPIGVLLLNMGGPDSLRAVRPFLYNLFSDRMIIRLGPAPLQKPLAFLISSLRAGKARKMYAQIGGKSPLNPLTTAQAKALSSALKIENDFKIYIGMRYWNPFIREALLKMKNEGINRLIAVSLYPHYSLATTGSSLEQLRIELGRPGYSYECGLVKEWPTHPLYIEALSDTVKKGLHEFEKQRTKIPFVLFSAHGLPKKFVEEKGDPYPKQIESTMNAVAEKTGLKKYALSFQSRTGPVEWLKPYTDEMIKELAKEGIKNLLIVPISFVSDHIETLYEIDILYSGLARGLGMNMKRTEALNTHPLLIAALKDLILQKKKELGW
jgi:ferrochelatase